MSYILDALRRADAERDRGGVPSLHAQPVPLLSSDGDDERRGPAPWVWMAAGAVLVVAALLAWQFVGGETVPTVPAAGAGATSGESPAATSTATTAAPVVSPPVAAAPAPPATEATAPARDEAAPAKPAPARKPAADAPPRRTPPPATPTMPAHRAPPSAGAATNPAAAATNPPDARIHAIHELPDDVRRDLPKLAIGGSVYSEQPSDRMLIVNGQVAREKDRLGPELVLEQIRLKSAVLRFRGYRYELAY